MAEDTAGTAEEAERVALTEESTAVLEEAAGLAAAWGWAVLAVEDLEAVALVAAEMVVAATEGAAKATATKAAAEGWLAEMVGTAPRTSRSRSSGRRNDLYRCTGGTRARQNRSACCRLPAPGSS